MCAIVLALELMDLGCRYLRQVVRSANPDVLVVLPAVPSKAKGIKAGSIYTG
jgi:hypothetical protein